MAQRAALERNLRLYSLHQMASHALFWGPVFFLFFSERFPVDQVIRLGAIYYVAVVLLEVPSGWFSDRVSRVVTLRIANAAMTGSQLLFLFGGDAYPVFVSAQVMLALGYAFRSGTDTSFHFDTLAALGRESSFAEREARIHRNVYVSVAVSALVGGGLGALDLRSAYALQAAALTGAFAIALLLHEPPRQQDGFAHSGLLRQLGSCLSYLRSPTLAWIFGYVILMTTTAHVPWEFAQPYVASVFGEAIDAARRTPLATGLLHALIALLGAAAAARSIALRERLGVGGTLLSVTALQTALIVAMAWIVHPVVAAALVVRSVQPAVSDVVVNAAIVPRVPQAQRATYQSLHSFAGRLGFGLVLFALSQVGGPTEIGDAGNVEAMLKAAAIVSVLGGAALLATIRSLRP